MEGALEDNPVSSSDRCVGISTAAADGDPWNEERGVTSGESDSSSSSLLPTSPRGATPTRLRSCVREGTREERENNWTNTLHQPELIGSMSQ